MMTTAEFNDKLLPLLTLLCDWPTCTVKYITFRVMISFRLIQKLTTLLTSLTCCPPSLFKQILAVTCCFPLTISVNSAM